MTNDEARMTNLSVAVDSSQSTEETGGCPRPRLWRTDHCRLSTVTSAEVLRGRDGQLVAALVFGMARVPAHDREAHDVPGQERVELSPDLFVLEGPELVPL